VRDTEGRVARTDSNDRNTEWHMSLDHLYLCPLTSTDIPTVTGLCPNHCPFNKKD